MKKKSYIAACLLGGAVTASYAQTSVAIYGLLDSGVEHVTHVAPTGAGVTRMPSFTGSLPSRLGFRGTEDLGGGLNAVFTLESGIELDSGSSGQGRRLFGRQAFTGLSGPWGAVTVGRQYTMLFWSILESDILGPNVYGSGSMDSYIPNARADNALAYRGTFGGFTVGATYSFGRDTVNAGPSPAGANCAGENAANKQECREWSAMLKYDAANWGIAFAQDELTGGPGAFAGLTNSDLKDKRTTLNGYFKFDKTKVGAGVIRRNNEASPTPRSDLYFVGAAYSFTPTLSIDGEVLRLNVKDSSSRASLYVARGTYSFSKRTAAYITAGHIKNEGGLALSISSAGPGTVPVAGGSQNGIMVGMRHVF